jgi:hypothetical protein
MTWDETRLTHAWTIAMQVTQRTAEQVLRFAQNPREAASAAASPSSQQSDNGNGSEDRGRERNAHLMHPVSESHAHPQKQWHGNNVPKAKAV